MCGGTLPDRGRGPWAAASRRRPLWPPERRRRRRWSSVWYRGPASGQAARQRGVAHPLGRYPQSQLVCTAHATPVSGSPLPERQTRGNQREIDRMRAQKRKEKAGVGKKGGDDGLTPAQRKERDAKALQVRGAAVDAAELLGAAAVPSALPRGALDRNSRVDESPRSHACLP